MAEEFPELTRIKTLASRVNEVGESKIIDSIEFEGKQFPIYSFSLGTKDLTKPVVCIVAGVHGLERVGTQLALSYLESLLSYLSWEVSLSEFFKSCRLVFLPLVNPVGMYLNRRSNANGVDIMRNSPVEAEGKTPFLLGGHRISSRLPWYRGPEGAPIEKETQILIDFIKKEIFPAEAVLTLDLHSGFGAKDRLWFPYAKTAEEFPGREQALKIEELLESVHPNHPYLIETQSNSYTTHGDLWDYLYDEYRLLNGNKKTYLPWTLEMGSWRWLKKNPAQIFSSVGLFNPVIVHRHQRIMRRHKPLFNFFLRIARNHTVWSE